MSSTSWLRSLDPIPGNVTGNSEWAGPAPERGGLGGPRTPGGPGHTGTQGRARRWLPTLPGAAPGGLPPPAPCSALRPPRSFSRQSSCREFSFPAARSSVPLAPGLPKTPALPGGRRWHRAGGKGWQGGGEEGVPRGDPRGRVLGVTQRRRRLGPSPVRELRWERRGGFWGALGECEPAPHFLCPGARPSLFLIFPTGVINTNYGFGAAEPPAARGEGAEGSPARCGGPAHRGHRAGLAPPESPPGCPV